MQKADAILKPDLVSVIDNFLLSRRVANCTRKTMIVYETNLRRFARLVGFAVGDRDRNDMSMRIVEPASPPITRLTPEVVERYLDLLRRQERSVLLPDGEERVERRLSASTVHQAYRYIKTLCRWMVDTELLDKSPLRVKLRPPQTLPRTPDDEIVDRLLKHAGDGFFGTRLRVLITLYSDTGLRLTDYCGCA
ncbi:MAG TPA: hypothetical protein VKZ50_06050 [bacterium]|nr:hypothetical protein [bacterium]